MISCNLLSNKFKLLTTTFVVTALAACASLDYKTGTTVSDEVYNNFIAGATKKSDVTALLGEPQKVRQEDGNTVYVYSIDTIAAIPLMPNTNKSVVLIFNDKGLLFSKNRTQSNTTSVNPLTGR